MGAPGVGVGLEPRRQPVSMESFSGHQAAPRLPAAGAACRDHARQRQASIFAELALRF